jgi:hypothetical protein
MALGTWFAQCDCCLRTCNLGAVPRSWRVNEADGEVLCGRCLRGSPPKAGGVWKTIKRIGTLPL